MKDSLEARFVVDSDGGAKDKLVLELKKIFDPLEHEVEMIVQQGTVNSKDYTEVATALLKARFSATALENLRDRFLFGEGGLNSLENSYSEGTFPLSRKIDWARALSVARRELRGENK